MKDRGRRHLCFHAIFVSLPEVRAGFVQSRIPANELGRSDAVLAFDFFAVVAFYYCVVLSAR